MMSEMAEVCTRWQQTELSRLDKLPAPPSHSPCHTHGQSYSHDHSDRVILGQTIDTNTLSVMPGHITVMIILTVSRLVKHNIHAHNGGPAHRLQSQNRG